MKTLQNLGFVFGAIAWVLISAPLKAGSFSAVDSSKTDSLVTDSTITYYHVDLSMEMEWDEPDIYRDVKVSVVSIMDDPQYVKVWEKNGETVTIDLLDGMIISIIHPKTGEVLKTFYIVRPDEN